MKFNFSSVIKPNSALWHAIVFLDAAFLGGIATLWLVRALLVQIMYRLVSADAQGEILNVLDHMLPLYVYYGGILLILTVLTSLILGVRTGSWRMAALPVAAFLALSLVPFLPF